MSGGALATQMVASLIMMPFLVRSFGLADYGLYMLALSISSYATLLDLGVGSSLVKFVAERRARDEHHRVEEVISSALGFYVLVGVVAAVGLAILAFNAQDVFRLTGNQALLVRNLFLVAAVVSVFSWPISTAYHTLGGLQRYDLIARNQLLQTVSVVLLTIATVVLHKGPLFLMIGQSAVNVSAGLLNVMYARRELEKPNVSPLRARRVVLSEIMSFSWAVFVAQVSIVIVYSQTDRIVLGIFVGAAAIGLYEAAGKFQTLIGQLSGLTNTAVMPAASQFSAEGRRSMLESLFLRGTKYICAFINPIVVVMIVLAQPIIIHWLGLKFLSVVLAAQVLSSYALLTIGTTIGDSMIVGLGKLPKRIPYIIAITLANLILSVVLVQRIGIMGVVLGTAVPWYLEYPSHIRFLLKHLEVPFKHWFRKVVLATYPLLIVPGVVAWLGMQAGFASNLIEIAGLAAVSIGLYWALVFWIGFEPDDRRDVIALVQSVIGRLSPA